MCGSDENIRIERVGNGYTIDAYTPGEKDKPGKHHRSVATSSEHVMRAVGKHLGKGGKKRKGGRVTLMSEGESASRPTKKAKRKSAARKRYA